MTTIYDVLKRPIITEKSNYQNTFLHQYVFEVDPGATKRMIKDAVETIFDVTVLRVNVLNMPKKRSIHRLSRRATSRKRGYKKAIVTLDPEDTIQVFEGVK